MKLDIIYEDNDILICFKPAGIATQTSKVSEQDMVSLIKIYLAKERKEKSPYVGVIHRLDQPVSGLLVFAKNKEAAASLSRQIQDGDANKDYMAFCTGILEEKKKTLVHYIAKDPVTKLARVISEEEYGKRNKDFVTNINGVEKNIELSDYKKAILTYEVEKEFEDASIIKVHLQTGRFHQIRAQFSFIGHALLGDVKYGNEDSKKIAMKHRIRMVALCANELDLMHPITGEKLQFILPQSKLPKEMRDKNEIEEESQKK